MNVTETERLRLRWMHAGDAPFILELVNEPGWIRYIGDKNVRSVEDAQRYIENGPAKMYRDAGFGLNLVELRNGEAIGMCGLIRRDTLPDADLGFALASRAWGRGYAFEAAAAAMRHARASLGQQRIVAIVANGNDRSVRLLDKLGFAFEDMVQLAPDAEPLQLFASSR